MFFRKVQKEKGSKYNLQYRKRMINVKMSSDFFQIVPFPSKKVMSFYIRKIDVH
jgi:hypothetical protein